MAYLAELSRDFSSIDCGKRYRMGWIAAFDAKVATKTVLGFDVIRPPL